MHPPARLHARHCLLPRASRRFRPASPRTSRADRPRTRFPRAQTSVTGRVTLELSQLRFSRIIFQYSHRPPSAVNLAPDPRIVPSSASSTPTKQPTLFLPPDHQAVAISTDEPEAVHLDRERDVILVVDPGRNAVTRIALRLAVATPDVHLGALDAQLADADRASSTEEAAVVVVRGEKAGDGDAIVLEGLRPFEPVRVRVPLRGNIVSPLVEVRLVALESF